MILLNFRSETIICYGGCSSTVRFNTTCPPGIKLQKGYHVIDTCNCSNSIDTLNCDGIIKNHVMRQPKNEILLDKNVCILDTIYIHSYPVISCSQVVSSHDSALYTNIDLLINIYIPMDLIINTTSNRHHNQMISVMKINNDRYY